MTSRPSSSPRVAGVALRRRRAQAARRAARPAAGRVALDAAPASGLRAGRARRRPTTGSRPRRGRDGVEVVRNDAPERGIASSLQCALGAIWSRGAGRRGRASASPTSRSSARTRTGALAGALRRRRALAVATYDGRARQPGADRPRALARGAGARRRRGRAGAHAPPRRRSRYRATDTGEPADVDTPEDLGRRCGVRRWRSKTASE